MFTVGASHSVEPPNATKCANGHGLIMVVARSVERRTECKEKSSRPATTKNSRNRAYLPERV